MVVMTSPYLNGGGGGGGGLTGMPGDASSPLCNGGVTLPGSAPAGYFSPANNLNNNNNHIPAAATSAASLYPPPAALPSTPQMSAQTAQLSQPHLVKPFLNSSTTPMTSQYIYFPSAVPMSDPFAYSTLMSMGAGQQAALSVNQSNLLSAAAAQPPLQPQFYAAAPFSGLEHYMNYKNGHLGAALSSPVSPSSPPFLSSPVQLNPERPMMYSSHVPDVSLCVFAE
jgi:hypothetical protein